MTNPSSLSHGQRVITAKGKVGTVDGLPYCNRHGKLTDHCEHEPNTVHVRIGKSNHAIVVVQLAGITPLEG